MFNDSSTCGTCDIKHWPPPHHDMLINKRRLSSHTGDRLEWRGTGQVGVFRLYYLEEHSA